MASSSFTYAAGEKIDKKSSCLVYCLIKTFSGSKLTNSNEHRIKCLIQKNGYNIYGDDSYRFDFLDKFYMINCSKYWHVAH